VRELEPQRGIELLERFEDLDPGADDLRADTVRRDGCDSMGAHASDDTPHGRGRLDRDGIVPSVANEPRCLSNFGAANAVR